MARHRGGQTRPVGLTLLFDVADLQTATDTFARLDREIRTMAAMARKLDCPARILFALLGCQRFMASADLRNDTTAEACSLQAVEMASMLAGLQHPAISNQSRPPK